MPPFLTQEGIPCSSSIKVAWRGYSWQAGVHWARSEKNGQKTAKTKENRGIKLSDGKSISGRGRLSDAIIDKLQNYYGLAIIRNIASLEDMRKTVWATYFHMASTDTNPSHGLCPKDADTCPKFNKAQLTGEPHVHEEYFPASVLQVVELIYQHLANLELLAKCIQGKTQNPNESFNHVVWERAQKTLSWNTKH